MDETRHIPALAQRLSIAASLACFVLLTTQSVERPYYPLALIPYAAVLYVVNALFLRRARTLRALVLLNSALSIAMFLSVLLAGQIRDLAELIFAAAICVGLAARTGANALKKPGLRSRIMCMELSLAVLVVFTGACTAVGLDANWCFLAAFAAATAILSVMVSRMENTPDIRSWVLILLAFLLLFGALGVLMRYAASPAGGGVVALWNWLVSAVWYILRLIWRLLVFLASLLPAAEEIPYEPETAAPVLPEQPEFTAGDGYMAMAMVVLAVLAVFFCLIWLLMRLGKIHVGGRTAGRQIRARARPSLWAGLRRFWQHLRQNIALRLGIWRRRDTPEGLLCVLIRRCRLGPWHKQTGETPREFLTRLQGASMSDSALYDALDHLIPAVDAVVYGRAQRDQTFPSSALVRRRIGAAVRRQFAAECLQKLKSRLGRA